MGLEILTLGASKKYTAKTTNGLGSLKGAPCTIKSTQETDEGTIVTFEWTGTSGATETAQITVKNGVDGQPGADGLNGADGKSVTGVTVDNQNQLIVEFSDGTTQNAGTIAVSADGVTVVDGKSAYEIWLEQGNSGTEQDFLASLKGDKGDTGAQGIQGEKGEAGETGATGNGVLSSEVTYQSSTSGSVIPTETWETTVPSVENGSYLWTRTIITYTDGTSTTLYSISRMGVDGVNGKDGTNGTDGANGTDGKAATITVGTVTTGEAGTDATVVNSGTENAAVLDFVIPKGDKGDSGETLFETISVNNVSLTPDENKNINIEVPSIDGLTKDVDLATVAKSGSYNDLTNTPSSLPADGGNADTVNNHTVESDVPSNAVFTDTVYDDTAILNQLGSTDISSFGDTITGAISSIGSSVGSSYKTYDLASFVTNDAYTGSGDRYFYAHVFRSGKLTIISFAFYNVTLSSSASIKVEFGVSENFYTEVFKNFRQISYVLPQYVNVGGPPIGTFYSDIGNFLMYCTKGTSTASFTLTTPDLTTSATATYPISTYCIGYIDD